MELACVVVKQSPIHGKGAFAAVDLKAGDIILERDDSHSVTARTTGNDALSRFSKGRLQNGTN